MDWVLWTWSIALSIDLTKEPFCGLIQLTKSFAYFYGADLSPLHVGYLEIWEPDVLGGPVVKNPLANAQDMGSIHGRGRSHMSQGN